MKKKSLSIIAILLVVVMLFAACSPSAPAAPGAQGAGAAGGAETMHIRISTDLTEASLTGQALNMMVDRIYELSEGRITAQVFYGGALGVWTAVAEMIQTGDLAMWTTNPVAFETQVVELATLSEHYAFDDLAHVHRFLEGPGGEFMKESWRSINMVGLAHYSLGFRQLTNSRNPVHTIEDVAGLTLRSFSPIQADAWASVGAVPTSVDWGELFVSMQQGLIDGQEGGITTIYDFSFFEVQNYLTLTDHMFSTDVLLASTAWFDSLSAGDQEIIRQAAWESYEWHRDAYQAALDDIVSRLESEHGLQVTHASPELFAAMGERMRPATASRIIEISGQEIYDRVRGYIEAAR